MKNSFNSVLNGARNLFGLFLLLVIIVSVMSMFGDFLPTNVEAEENPRLIENQQEIYDKVLEDVQSAEATRDFMFQLLAKVQKWTAKAEAEVTATNSTLCATQVVLSQLKANETTDPVERARLTQSLAAAESCVNF